MEDGLSVLGPYIHVEVLDEALGSLIWSSPVVAVTVIGGIHPHMGDLFSLCKSVFQINK